MKKLMFALIVATAALVAIAARFAPPLVAYEYTTEPVELGTLTETVSATGTLQAKGAVSVGMEATGRVTRVAVEAGQEVNAGDVLITIDDRLAGLRVQQARGAVEMAQAEAQRAEAARDAARSALQRAKEGVAQAAMKSATEQAETQLRLTEAGLRAAQARVKEAVTGQQLAEYALELTTLRAPRSGIVLECRAVTGQLVGPPTSAQLFLIAPDLARLELVALVAEADVAFLRPGTPARFTVNARPDSVMTGTVEKISLIPVSPPGTAVYYSATIGAANFRDPQSREWALRPGMPASVDFVTRRHEKVWKLPAAAVGLDLTAVPMTEPAKQKLDRWKRRGDLADWQRVWVVGPDKSPWPVFLRVGGRGPRGETGIQDGVFLEVLDWDPEEKPPTEETEVRVITSPPVSDHADRAGLKLF